MQLQDNLKRNDFNQDAIADFIADSISGVNKPYIKPLTFSEYYKLRFPEYDHEAPHVKLLISTLEGMVHNDALIINMPSGFGKSNILSAWCEYLLGREYLRIIYACFGPSLANTQSRVVRNAIAYQHPAFVRHAPNLQVAGDASAVGTWELTNGSRFWAGGLNTSPIGERCEWLFLDDPHKNISETENKRAREKTIDSINNEFLNRFGTGTRNLVINHQRLGIDDTTGYFLNKIAEKHQKNKKINQERKEKGLEELKLKGYLGFNWKHISLAALDKNDKSIWEAGYPTADLLEIRESLPRMFSSRYQQHPIAQEGSLYKNTYYYEEDELPKYGFRNAIAFDLAYTVNKSSDYSVILSGRFKDGILYITNMIRVKVESPEFLSYLESEQDSTKATAYIRYGGTEIGTLNMMEESVRIISKPTRGDKLSNAQSSAMAWNSGKILVPSIDPRTSFRTVDNDWVEIFVNEVLDFSGSGDAFDDCVDALVTLHKVFTTTEFDDIKPKKRKRKISKSPTAFTPDGKPIKVFR